VPQPAGQSVFRLRIQLNDVNPTIWRRLLVPGSVRMAKLADMLIAVMGWENSHLHEFRVGDVFYGMHVEDHPDEEVDEKGVTVLQSLRDQQSFSFHYDFGDSWRHEVVIEGLFWSYSGLKYAVCLEGANACPPEDVGGVGGYADFLEAIADRSHDEHESYLEWVGWPFDPSQFNLADANALLQKVR
jgi:pRiA4b ORF-3-like protein